MTIPHASRMPSLRSSLLGRQLLFFEPDTGANPPGGTTPPADDRQNLQGLLQRHNNDAMAVIATLMAENHGLRDGRRELRSQVPPPGAVVLTAEQATQWQAYQQLGAVDALTAERTQAQTAQQELATLKRGQLVRDAADVAGYKASVLARLAGELPMEIRDTTVDGKAVKSVIVKDGDKETPLADYAKAQWADFLPSLQASAAAQQPAGTTFVPQPAGGQAPANPLDAYIKDSQKQRDSAHNPLAPKPPA